METKAINPAQGIYPATDDYIHGLEVRGAKRFLFVSGTMGLQADGQPGKTLDQQLTLIWSNIRTILAYAAMTTDNIVRITSYLRDASYMSANEAARLEALGSHRVPVTTIVAQTLSPEWLVEVEIIAAG